MTAFLGRFCLLLLLVLPTTFMLAGPDGNSPILVNAEEDGLYEDVLDDEEEGDATVETDDGIETGSEAVPVASETTVSYHLAPSRSLDNYLPAGKEVKFLVGFANKGATKFVVESMDAAFRYPQDYSFYIQNDGNIFQDAVFNETINVVEPDEGLDGETYRKHITTKPKPAVEMGTQNKSDIDFDWIPKENLNNENKSPRRSPKSKTSPRQRRTKRNTGSAED
ncbi:hypothetical protein LSH36_270g02015 [Paralvinella palmiformis]|uniref:Translocon-associated protein subunit alpha n=1 Tax=Paralvinella palmiformis TaxID=53620 RepID=A0AAD9N3R6_9ANNE|nr:hypothetical protein LSH36_270g02015 [Paralvinella palmiformis]